MRRKTNLNKYDIKEIIKIYRMGCSLSSIGRDFNLHPQTVKRLLQKYSEPLRNLSQAMKEAHKKYGKNKDQ